MGVQNPQLINLRLKSNPANGKSISGYGTPLMPLLVASADFSDGNLTPPSIYEGYEWGQGAQGGGVAVIENGGYKISYPSTAGAQLSWLNLNVPYGLREVFIDFDATMPNAKNGLKFLKVFGINATGGNNEVANCTLGLDYTGLPEGKGSLAALQFGDGTTLINDSNNKINLDGTHPEYVGRAWGHGAIVNTPMQRSFSAAEWGTGKHNFKFHVKFNDGTSAENEVNNGAFTLYIDGNLYFEVKNIFNRHWSNGYIGYIEFGGWSQGSGPAFDLIYDNIKFSRHGFII